MGLAHAGGEPGRFDYWVLALSWQPEFCNASPAEPECRLQAGGFVVHGLWPQYEDGGYPSFCGSRSRVDQAWVERLAPIMPSRELIQYEWNKHGVCSGLSPDDYFMLLERARRALSIPEAYQSPTADFSSDVVSLKQRFVEANPDLPGSALALQCGGRYLREIRVCFDRELQPRACSAGVEDHCRDARINVRAPRSEALQH